MLIRVEKLSYEYKNSIQALRDVSFEIAAGELVSITGHNGSGKSTLVKQLNGLLTPSEGTVWINDINTSNVQPATLAKRVALLFQNPDDQICKRTVWDEVAFGPKNLGYTPRVVESLVDGALNQFDLQDHAQQNPHDFGYSIRKRITMASIVAMDSAVVIFDEPTAGLDSYEVSLLLSSLKTLQAENKTVIVISHDMDFVAENFSRVISMENGEIVFDGTVRNLFQEHKLLQSGGLQKPQVVQLCNAFGMSATPLTPEECYAEFKKRAEIDLS